MLIVFVIIFAIGIMATVLLMDNDNQKAARDYERAFLSLTRNQPMTRMDILRLTRMHERGIHIVDYDDMYWLKDEPWSLED